MGAVIRIKDLGKPRNLKYQTARASPQGIPTRSGVRTFEGADELLNMGMAWLVNKLNKVKMEAALKKLEPTIRNFMPKQGGVLLGVVYQEPDNPESYGFPTMLFMYVYIMGGGADMKSVYAEYQKRISFTGTVTESTFNEHWYKVEELLWVTY